MTSTSFTDLGNTYRQASDTLEKVTSPLSEAVNTGMDWLLYPFVAPLLELLELVVGDPDQLDRHAQAWQQAATQIEDVAHDQERQLARLLDGWEGEAAQAYAAKITQLVQSLREAGQQMTGTADSLADTATDLRNAEELLRTIIRELVEWLIITWLAAQALAWCTGAASELAAADASILESIVALMRAKRVVDALRYALYEYAKAIEVVKARGALGQVAAFMVNPARLLLKPVIKLSGMDGSVGEIVDSTVDGLVTAVADEADDHHNGTDGGDTGLEEPPAGLGERIGRSRCGHGGTDHRSGRLDRRPIKEVTAVHEHADIPDGARAQNLRDVTAATLPPGETLRYAGWVVQVFGGHTRQEDIARLKRNMFRVDPIVEELTLGLVDPSAEADEQWRRSGRSGALFGPTGSVAAMVDSCLPFAEDNPVVLAVTATSLVILWPATPLPPPPPPPPMDFSLRGAVRLGLRVAGQVQDYRKGRPIRPDKYPRVRLAPIPSPAPQLMVRWQLPLSYVASVTADGPPLFGIVDITFTDTSRLRIAAPTHDHDAFAAAITGRTG